MEQLTKAIESIRSVCTSEDLTPRERNDLWHIAGQISDILSAAEGRAERTKENT